MYYETSRVKLEKAEPTVTLNLRGYSARIWLYGLGWYNQRVSLAIGTHNIGTWETDEELSKLLWKAVIGNDGDFSKVQGLVALINGVYDGGFTKFLGEVRLFEKDMNEIEFDKVFKFMEDIEI